MDKLIGTVKPVSTDKEIASIQIRVRISPPGLFRVADIQFQDGVQNTQYNKPVFERMSDEKVEEHFNFIARGNTTVIVPYGSEIPYGNGGKMLPCESDYITTPIKTNLLIHRAFNKSSENLSLGSGTNGTGRKFTLNSNVAKYTECVYNGYTSEQSIGGGIGDNLFEGPNIRLANADNKYTLLQSAKRKSTGVLYTKKTRKEG